MEHQVMSVPVERLRFDSRNPRIWTHGATEEQEKIGRALYEESHLGPMMKDMAEGIYSVAPQPLLALEEQGQLTVVDGNRRLLSIKLLTETGFAKETTRETVPEIDQDTAQALKQVTVAVMKSWHEIHRVRVRHQLATGSKWSTLIHAQDFRRLLLNGDSPTDVYQIHAYTVSKWVNALNFLEQVNSVSNAPWNKQYQFPRLIKALNQPSIREKLKLGDPGWYGPNEKPLTNESTIHGLRLMVHLHGPAVQEEMNHIDPKIETDQDLRYLDRVYRNEKALEKMNSWSRYTAKDACDWLDGFPEPNRIIELAEQIHAAAVRELREIKEEKPELIAHAGLLHVAHASHTIYNDRSTQYMVHLKSKSPDTHQEAANLLQNRLRTEGYECVVTF